MKQRQDVMSYYYIAKYVRLQTKKTDHFRDMTFLTIDKGRTYMCYVPFKAFHDGVWKMQSLASYSIRWKSGIGKVSVRMSSRKRLCIIFRPSFPSIPSTALGVTDSPSA